LKRLHGCCRSGGASEFNINLNNNRMNETLTLPCLHAGVISDCEPDHAPGDIGLTAIITSLTQTAKMQCGEMFYPRVSLYQSAIITPCGDSSRLLTAFHILVNQEISNRTLHGLPRNQFLLGDESQKILCENSSKIAFAEA